jgi:hypothetical protein
MPVGAGAADLWFHADVREIVTDRPSNLFDELTPLSQPVGNRTSPRGSMVRISTRTWATAMQRVLSVEVGLRTHGLGHIAAVHARGQRRRSRPVSGYC